MGKKFFFILGPLTFFTRAWLRILTRGKINGKLKIENNGNSNKNLKRMKKEIPAYEYTAVANYHCHRNEMRSPINDSRYENYPPLDLEPLHGSETGKVTKKGRSFEELFLLQNP